MQTDMRSPMAAHSDSEPFARRAGKVYKVRRHPVMEAHSQGQRQFTFGDGDRLIKQLSH